MYHITNICNIVKGRFQQQGSDGTIAYLVYDSRKVQFAQASLFFALHTPTGDGHRFINQAYKQGVRNFIVAHEVDVAAMPESNVIIVPNVLLALQQLAAHHRQLFKIPILGITGSNGKTIVKEWLYQLLQDDFNIVRSPKSYNSQIGVPLSVWQLTGQHTLGIFEAGVSQPGEMAHLQNIIQPTIGILTNIGEAHDEGFTSQQQKLEEKMKLFAGADVVIANSDYIEKAPAINKFSWGKKEGATVQIKEIEKGNNGTTISIVHAGKPLQFWIPFVDDASVENAITCCCVLLYLKIDATQIIKTFSKLHAVDMRLHLMQGINNCTIINDSYSADITSLHIALSFMQQQNATQKRSVILSDFVESGKSEEDLYSQIATLLQQFKIEKVVGVGEKISLHLPQYLSSATTTFFFKTTDELLQHFRTSLVKEEMVLIKGARKFQFERIVPLLEYKVHQTQLEINLNAIVHNLKQYSGILKSGTRIMAMVKAFAYGSGGAEIAGVLQYNNVDYLGVAYTDEGVDLRKSGITLPVMVMNVDETSFGALIEYNLQPVIYSFALLHQFEAYVSSQGLQLVPVHIEVETGMNRLGFAVAQIESLGQHLAQSSLLKVESVYTHLAASEDEAQDAFTLQQAQLFQKSIGVLTNYIAYPFLKHMANSAAIIRHPQLQFDMVRLGIGLYGIEIATDKLELQTVANLRTTIAQIKHLKAGETVSYNRRGVVDKDAVIATVRIGYADGYSRRLGNGVGKMFVRGRFAPVIGTVCMDMTMIDITDIPGVKEGDSVIVFGEHLPVQQLAAWMETIPYEAMTSISQRVKRIYFQE